MLLALLLPDPCNPYCPAGFKREARDILSEVRNSGQSDADLQRGLLWFIGSLASWDLANHRVYLKVARDLVRAAHPEDPPLVVDPFAGGGAIPLEALRLGCETIATDLNPVACLILKVMLEEIPSRGPALADDLRRLGAEIKGQAEKDLTPLYPKDPDGASPIAYLWARTVRCESPNCGAEIPLVRSFWLSTKAKRRRALRHRVERPNGEVPRVEFEIFEPRADRDVPKGTVAHAKARCICCGVVLSPDRVREQLAAQRGGADTVFDARGSRAGGAKMLAVVLLNSGETGRRYRLPCQRDYDAVRSAQASLAKKLDEWEGTPNRGLRPFPDEPTPMGGGSGAGRAFSLRRYGMREWGDLLTARQKVALRTLVELTATRDDSGIDAPILAVGKLLDLGNALCTWMPGQECPSAVFKLGRVKVGWDFVEGCMSSESSGSFQKCTSNLAAGVVATAISGSQKGQALQAMAQQSPIPDDTAAIWFTDPPYYDAIPYADLADFFLVWMRRIAPKHPLLRDRFDPSNPLSPKDQEAVQDDSKQVSGQPKDAAFFDSVMGQAFAEGGRVLRDDGIGSVVFAHKTTEGWEALLSGMIRGGWTITGSWPIATEMGHRLRARESAALATSVHLVCRPRPEDAPVGDWSGVLAELPGRVRDWMKRLQDEGVRGADLVFACIGPALEIYRRYRDVETAEGRTINLGEYLAKVWEVVGRAALGQVLGRDATGGEAAVGALEEDARLSALFLWTFQDTDVKAEARALGSSPQELGAEVAEEDEEDARPRSVAYSLPFDVVRRFAQPLGIHLEVWEDRIIKTDKGAVRLLSVADRAKQLFGEGGAGAVAERLESDRKVSPQGLLFPEMEPAAKRGRGRKKKARVNVSEEETQVRQEATTLDRVHAAMLLQAAGRANALRALLQAEQERGPDFGRLANALSALYPRGSHERRLLEAMLVAMPR